MDAAAVVLTTLKVLGALADGIGMAEPVLQGVARFLAARAPADKARALLDAELAAAEAVVDAEVRAEFGGT